MAKYHSKQWLEWMYEEALLAHSGKNCKIFVIFQLPKNFFTCPGQVLISDTDSTGILKELKYLTIIKISSKVELDCAFSSFKSFKYFSKSETFLKTKIQLYNLLNNKNNVIQKADKWNKVVILNKVDYLRKVNEILDNTKKFKRIHIDKSLKGFQEFHMAWLKIRKLLKMEHHLLDLSFWVLGLQPKILPNFLPLYYLN